MITRRILNSYWPDDDAKLSLDFTSGVLPSGVDFSRAANTATRINSSGLVETMSADQPRFDYDPTSIGTPRGLLIEGSSTSLTRSSQDLTNASYWTLQTAYASTSATGGTAPDGTNTGNLFTEPSSNLQRSIYQSYSSAAGTYTFSVWLKAGSGSTRYMRLVVSSGASDFGYVTINMSTGALQQPATAVGTATNASATVSGNYTATGWRRCSLTVTLAASVNFVFLVPIDLASIDTPTTNYGRVSYLGNGSSFLIWGAQLEAGSGASSYIPTGASQQTRNPDICTVSGAAFSSWYNASEGTFFADFRRRRTDNTASVLSANNNSTAEVIEVAADTAAKFNIVDNGSPQVASFVTPFLANTDTKLAGAFKLNDCQVASNGAAANVDSTATIPTVDRLYIGRDAGAVPVYLDGHVRSVKFYDYRKDQTKLVEMTT